MRRAHSKQAKSFLLLLALVLLAACTTPSSTPTPQRTLLPHPSDTPTSLPANTITATLSLPSPTATTAPPSSTPTPIRQAGHDSIGDPKAPELGNTGYDVLRYTLALEISPQVRSQMCAG